MARGRAVILATATRISPFGDRAAEALFTDETVAEAQARAFRALGFEIVQAAEPAEAHAIAGAPCRGPVVLLLDRVYISEKAARDFVRVSKTVPRPAALFLPLGAKLGASVDYTLPLQDLRREADGVVHDVLRVDGVELLPPLPSEDAVAWVHRLRSAAALARVPLKELIAEVPLPVIGEGRGQPAVMRYPLTSTLVVSIEHWVHVLWLNQLAFGLRWIELLRRRPIWGLWRALSALSLDRDRILARMNRFGRRNRIHPTAWVSGSILGDDVTVGAHVTLRNAIVGPGTVIQDHAVLLNSVVGRDCLITENTFLVHCASYPDSTIGNYKLQVSLIGRGAFINAWAGFIDAKFVGGVKVQHNGALVDTERSFLGSVVGHRARVASKVLIQAGREIPNDTLIVMRPDEVVSHIPENLMPDRPYVRHGGTLVPLGQEGGL